MIRTDAAVTGSAELVWNVRSSFRAYVTAVEGTIDVLDPASHDDLAFVFPATPGDSGDDGTVLKFEGGVRFTAHAGAMNVLILDPWLHLDGSAARLSIAGSEATRTAGGRLFFAQLASAEPSAVQGMLEWRDVPATLLGEGAVAFDFQYPTGAELSPVTYRIPNSAVTNDVR